MWKCMLYLRSYCMTFCTYHTLEYNNWSMDSVIDLSETSSQIIQPYCFLNDKLASFFSHAAVPSRSDGRWEEPSLCCDGEAAEILWGYCRQLLEEILNTTENMFNDTNCEKRLFDWSLTRTFVNGRNISAFKCAHRIWIVACPDTNTSLFVDWISTMLRCEQSSVNNCLKFLFYLVFQKPNS